MSAPAIIRKGLPALAAAVILTILMAAYTTLSTDSPAGEMLPGRQSAQAALTCVSPDVECYVRSLHEQLNVEYPPKGMTLAAFKHERVLELWAETDGGPVLIKTYDFCAASGRWGPKLKRGDYQVPEGVYNVVNLNDRSKFHLSLLIDYPNAFDRRMATADGRGDLGSDICIHGGCVSAGCIALGDEAIEEIFQVATDVGMRNCRTIIAPYDFRRYGPPSPEKELRGPGWVRDLYRDLSDELKSYPRPA